jgi:hypothetical protein
MSPASAKRLIAFFRKREQHQGVTGLMGLIFDLRGKLLDHHMRLSISDNPQQEVKKVKWKGETRPIWEVSISRRCNGLAIALNLLDFRGLIIARQPTIKDFKIIASELSTLVDPFIDFIGFDGTRVIEDKSTAKYNRHLVRKFGALHNRIIVKPSKDEFIYPYDDKSVLVTLTKSWKGYETIPSDLVEQLYLMPNLVHKKYKYFQHLVGEALMPSKDSFFQKSIELGHDGDIAGRAAILTKDGKHKLRTVYPASTMAQRSVFDLHKTLKATLKGVVPCCCFEAEKGLTWIKDKLKSGMKLSSLDLHHASDHIPLTPQLELARQVLQAHPWCDDIVDCFDHISRMKWMSVYDMTTYIRHRKGGPMGLMSCYYLFTLYIITNFYRIGLTDDDFIITGDDIVYDHFYHDRIMAFFGSNDIPISILKSIIGSFSLAEFCGRLVTSDGPLDYYKAKAFKSNNPLPVIKRLGFKAYKNFDKTMSSSRIIINSLRLSVLFEKQGKEIDILLPETPVDTNVGGYTIHQYYRMGLVTKTQLLALNILESMQLSDFHKTDEPWDTVYTYRKRKTKHTTVKGIHKKTEIVQEVNITLRTNLPFFNVIQFPGRSVTVILKSLLEYNLDSLYTKMMKSEEIIELACLKPAYDGRVDRYLKNQIHKVQKEKSFMRDRVVTQEEALKDYIPKPFGYTQAEDDDKAFLISLLTKLCPNQTLEEMYTPTSFKNQTHATTVDTSKSTSKVFLENCVVDGNQQLIVDLKTDIKKISPDPLYQQLNVYKEFTEKQSKLGKWWNLISTVPSNMFNYTLVKYKQFVKKNFL